MLAHDCGEDLLRQVEVAIVEVAQDAARLLHQIRDLVDEGGLVVQVDGAADAGREVGGLPGHRLASGVGGQHDASRLNSGQQLVGGGDLNVADLGAVGAHAVGVGRHDTLQVGGAARSQL